MSLTMYTMVSYIVYMMMALTDYYQLRLTIIVYMVIILTVYTVSYIFYMTMVLTMYTYKGGCYRVALYTVLCI